MRIAFAIARVVVASAGIAAVVGQLNHDIGYWEANGVTNMTLSVTNFFSFFTILSNVSTIGVMLIGSALLATRTGCDPLWFNTLRASVATYMIVTGIVYNLLLRGIELPPGLSLPWANEIMHVWVPVFILLDWVFAPGRAPMPSKTLWKILAFPIAWVVYTMVRGPFTPNEVKAEPFWYPYPFLNPNLSANGYLSVAFYIVLIALCIAAVAVGVIWISRRKPILTD